MRDEIVDFRELADLHKYSVFDLILLQFQVVEFHIAPDEEDLVDLVVEIRAAVEHPLLARRGHRLQIDGRDLDPELLAHLADGGVDGRLARGEMAGRGDVPQAGMVLLAARASLQQEASVGRHDPDVRGAMPVAVTVNAGLRLEHARRHAVGSKDVDQFHNVPMIERSEQDGIVTLRLAHGKASALDLELLGAISRALDEAADARGVILTGTGSIFSAGVDLFRMLDGGTDYVRAFVPALAATLRKLFTFPHPVGAAINGHAIAGGCILALACDERVMARGNGRIGVPELHVGVPFPPIALEIIRHAAPAAANRLILGGRTYAPDDAFAMGVVDALADDAVAAIEERIAEDAFIPAETFRLTKLQLRSSALAAADRHAATMEEEIVAVWSDPAIHAHIHAYLEKTIRKG